LTDVAPLDLGNGIILSLAQVNIASIKIKADSQHSEAEKEIERTLKAERKALEADAEASMQEFETRMEAAEQEHEALIEAAETDEDKESAKSAWEAQKAILEAEKSTLHQDMEDQLSTKETEIDKNVKLKGPYTFDLLTGTVSEELPKIELLDGSYKRIEFKMKPLRGEDASNPMLNHSALIIGTYQGQGFEIRLNQEEKFRLMGAGAMQFVAGESNQIAIVFDVSAWMSGVDFAGAEVDPLSNLILVDDQHNPTIYQLVKKNLKSKTRFGKDDDGDGELESDEEAGDGEEGAEELELEEEAEEMEDEENEADESDDKDSKDE
jgi:hypothetical protein